MLMPAFEVTSRWTPLWLIRTLPYVGDAVHSKAKPLADTIAPAALRRRWCRGVEYPCGCHSRCVYKINSGWRALPARSEDWPGIAPACDACCQADIDQSSGAEAQDFP